MISRLVMVDVSWSLWGYRRPEPPITRAALHRRLLIDLLAMGQDASVLPVSSPQEVEALAHEQDVGADDALLGPYRWHRGQEWPDAPVKGEDAARTVELLHDGLAACEALIDHAWLQRQRPLLSAQLNLFGCRLALRTEQPEASVAIDLRFQEFNGDYWLSTAFSISACGPLRLEDDTVRQLHQTYAHDLRFRLKGLLPAEFPRARMTVLERQHRPPRFWIVEQDGLAADPPEPAAQERHATVRPLVDVLLACPDPASTGVAASVLNRTTLVLRRFVPRDKGDLPAYLVVPWDAAGLEPRTQGLVRALTDLEAFAAAELFELSAALDRYRNLLDMYGIVARQASRLWDQVALYLPVARQLGRAHRYVELIHQVLLQGIADLDQVAVEATAARNRVEDTAYAVGDRFDRTFTERALPGHQPLRESLMRAGAFAQARQEADDTCDAAAEVKATYTALLEGVSHAFDERRARETDVLQRLGIGLALVLGFATIVPEAAANWIHDANPQLEGPLVLAGIAATALGMALVLRQLRRRRVLLTGVHRRLYHRLQTFLQHCETGRLDRLRQQDRQRLRDALREPGADVQRLKAQLDARWDARDQRLAGDCAGLIDAFASLRRPRRRRGLDLWGERVQEWALSALLVSERPRMFWRFQLPRLCLLYRCYPMIGTELAATSKSVLGLTLVADSDLRSLLANQCSRREDDIDQICRWAARRTRALTELRREWIVEDGAGSRSRSWRRHTRRNGLARRRRRGRRDGDNARRFLAELEELGVHGQMSLPEVEGMLERMRQA